MEKAPIPSPFMDEFDKYTDSFDTYDDLPATTAWVQSVGAALGKKFGLTVVPNSENWEIDHDKKEVRVGSFEDIYTRRGVLGLLLNGVGRLALSIKFPATKADATAFAAIWKVDAKLGKHFGALVKLVDELRTDDEISKQYAGGERVVDTMHAQAYDASLKAIQQMALDMRIRREMAREILDWLKNMSVFAQKLILEPESSLPMGPPKKLVDEAALLMKEWGSEKMSAAIPISLGKMLDKIERAGFGQPSGRTFAVLLIALYPQDTDKILKAFVRAYPRNVMAFKNSVSYAPTVKEEETRMLKLASAIRKDMDELKLFSSHTGGHAQYVLAKAEQYYHAHELGINVISPYGGYDMEAKALDVEAANEAAQEVSSAIIANGITSSVDGSIELSKEILAIIEPFPFLDLNDQKKDGNGGKQTNMGKRVAGGKGSAQRPQKRNKEREKKTKAQQVKDRKQMEAMDNKKNQEKMENDRDGYSILGQAQFTPLEKYLYLIGPYLPRINATAAKMRRILKVNDPAGLRGAYRRGKALNTRILYRHRVDDYRLFSRKEIEKDHSYGFAITGDLSGSTESRYGSKTKRLIQDEILAASFLIAEVAERIGEKVMVSISYFTNDAENVKRAGQYLSRGKIVEDIKNHGGGTNVQDAGTLLNEDLQELTEFKMKNKTIIFITDGAFYEQEFMETVKAAKKYKASIAYFQLDDNVANGVAMCKKIEKFVAQNAKDVRVRTRNVPTSAIHTLPEAMAQLMKESIGGSER